MVIGNVDILVVGETKLDSSFPKSQFKISGFSKPYRIDRNEYGGGVMIYVREDIPSQENPKKHKLLTNVEGLIVEINLRKMKFLLIRIYHSTNKDHGTSDDVFLCEIGKVIDVYSSFDTFLIVGDFNMQEGNILLEDFLCTYHAKI